MSEQQPKPSITFNSFADWCLHKDSLCEAAKHTVEELLKWAGTSDINEANQILSSKNKLDLHGNKISDLAPLQSLTHLVYLDLHGNKISDLTPLQSLTNLTSLSLNHNQISDLTSLQSLTNLTSLTLYNNKISDLTPLQSLTNLTSLSLDHNQISDLTSLQSLTNLTSLTLGENKISDLTPLQSLTNLILLFLNRNKISSLTPLQSLTSLTSLTLGHNQISDITPLQSLTNLTFLSLGRNQISDITHLQSLTNLTRLNLGQNQISDITDLQSLTNLTDLVLDSDQISDITHLQSLTTLTRLNLGENQISNITFLQFLTNLTDLELRENQISDITSLKYLTNLTYLNLANNPISDIAQLQYLTRLKDLTLNLTSQHQAIIEICRQKWGILANSTEPIKHSKASNALKTVCDCLDLKTPEITFCSSPHEAYLRLERSKQKDNEFKIQLDRRLDSACFPFTLITELWLGLSRSLEWERQLEQQLKSIFPDLWRDYRRYSTMSIVTPKYLAEDLAMAEFCVSALGMILKPESEKFFESLKQLLVECGWIFAFENVCYVCSRPIKLSLDREYRLHAEGESAIEFADGYKIYSYHGVTLPEKYGQIHPKIWEAKWLLEEENAELRRVLIQGISYARICSELQATELDSWQEYTLLQIENADVEPIHLLKMTCPSTGFIHALRVPPDLTSAREAIRWVNWDIDSDEFSVQT
ncbi:MULTISPECIES: leucine-rich repeat domain-containing protein [unclassified Microcoleus]|uniref:leucine-rich repeat domain-containing protein n=1 Tax=unclassified Microcoleus TaxID=2642155 RepID=UPI002FD4D30F